KGSKKYGDRNWELGQPLSRFLDSALRHLVKGLLGMEDEPHFEAAEWNIAGLIQTRILIQAGELPAELDDLPRRTATQTENLLRILFGEGAGAKVEDPHQLPLFEGVS